MSVNFNESKFFDVVKEDAKLQKDDGYKFQTHKQLNLIPQLRKTNMSPLNIDTPTVAMSPVVQTQNKTQQSMKRLQYNFCKHLLSRLP